LYKSACAGCSYGLIGCVNTPLWRTAMFFSTFSPALKPRSGSCIVDLHPFLNYTVCLLTISACCTYIVYVKAWKTGKRASEKDNYQAFKFFATVQPLGRIQDAVQV
jgi:hypothetical protein